MPRVLWKAANGREFIIDTDKEGIKTQEELMQHIDKLRKELGLPDPTFMSAHANAPEGEAFVNNMGAVDVDELNVDPELKQQIKQTMKEGLERPDPKKLN